MTSHLKKLLIRLSGNLKSQKKLQAAIDTLNFYTGIGAGGNPDSSGESALVDLFKECRSAPDAVQCVFDVGANNGGFINMLMTNLTGQKVFIHAFEPGRVAFADLQKRTSHHACLKLNNFGMGASSGELTLHYSEPGSALASLTKRRLDHFRRKAMEPETPLSETVRIETVDSYCEEHGIHEIDLLKIDVEGHELDVLKGAVGMLGAGKIRALTFEFGGCDIDTRVFFQDYWYFFKQFDGARIFRLTPSGYLLPIPKYLETLEQFRVSNYLVKMVPATGA